MFRIGVSTITLGLLLAGCAKEKKYEKVHIEDPSLHQSKALIEGMCTLDDPCLYVPSVADTPYNVAASRPFWQGEQKLVVGKITKDELKFLQVEEDERFNSNINNFSPVVSFGISHLDYKCRKDSYGDCTNAEEIDDEKSWEKRRFVELDVASFKVQEKNSLPIQFSELFQAGCFSATDQEITSVKVEKDAINLGVKKTYQAGADCIPLEEMDDLRYLTFTVDYKYSIVKLSSLADKNYQAVDYPAQDESYFGFFKSEQKKKTVDNHDHVMGIRNNILHRWSPNKKDVVYYLNDEFYKEGNEHILESTKQGIESVNRSLQIANAGFKVILKNGSDKSIGDLRNNFIILVNDPQASGVIGYGPTVTNPKTGEILNARTVMYYGTIKKFIGRAYDELVEETILNAQNAASQESTKSVTETQAVEGTQNVQNATRQDASKLLASVDLSSMDNFQLDSSNLSVLSNRNYDYMSSLLGNREDLKLEDVQRKMQLKRKELDLMARDTFFHGSNVNFDGAVISALGEKIKKGEQLKLWEQLSEDERSEIIKLLMPHVWVPTLVHEFGHNLGLRHNFSGSTDKENYYTSSERRALGMRKEISYSSIMDYAYRNNNELSLMGKYDIAALRFAYARKVEAKDGKIINLDETIQKTVESNESLALKKYQYCSDEHVNTNPLCNRFDEGATFSEVASHYINSYNKNYEKRNFRGRRYSFEGRSGDFQYVLGNFNIFMEMRQFFDIYDQRRFDGDYDSNDWKDNETLVDIKKGSDLVFDHFMNVLEMPAYQCIELDTKTQEITNVAPFTEMAKGTQLEDFGITFDIRYGCLFLNQYGKKDKAYFEFGKYFNNSLDLTVARDQIQKNDTSQIDVRGSWSDKAIASLFLASRFKSPTTLGASSSGNFLDVPEYAQRFEKLMDGMLTNNFTKKVTVTAPTGEKFEVPVKYGFEDHMINKSYNGFVNAFFGLSENRNNFKNIMLSTIKSELRDASTEGDIERDDSLYSRYDVDRISTKEDVSRYNYDKIVEFRSSNGVLNYRFGLYKHNVKAMELSMLKDQLDTIEKFLPAQIISVLKPLSEGKPVAEELKELESIGIEKLIDYLEGRLNQTTLLQSLIALSK